MFRCCCFLGISLGLRIFDGVYCVVYKLALCEFLCFVVIPCVRVVSLVLSGVFVVFFVIYVF